MISERLSISKGSKSIPYIRQGSFTLKDKPLSTRSNVSSATYTWMGRRCSVWLIYVSPFHHHRAALQTFLPAYIGVLRKRFNLETKWTLRTLPAFTFRMYWILYWWTAKVCLYPFLIILSYSRFLVFNIYVFTLGSNPYTKDPIHIPRIQSITIPSYPLYQSNSSENIHYIYPTLYFKCFWKTKHNIVKKT